MESNEAKWDGEAQGNGPYVQFPLIQKRVAVVWWSQAAKEGVRSVQQLILVLIATPLHPVQPKVALSLQNSQFLSMICVPPDQPKVITISS